MEDKMSHLEEMKQLTMKTGIKTDSTCLEREVRLYVTYFIVIQLDMQTANINIFHKVIIM